MATTAALAAAGCSRDEAAAQAAALASARVAQARAEGELKAIKEAAVATAAAAVTEAPAPRAPPAATTSIEPSPTPTGSARNAHCGCRDASCLCATVIVTLTVDARKPGNKEWDALGGAPDPVVSLRAPSGSHTSKVFQDQLSVRGAFSVMPLTPGDHLQFDVTDQDAAVSDPIGTFGMTFRGIGATVKGKMDAASIEVSIEP